VAWTSLWGLDPVGYRPHVLHDETRAWPQTSCYVDVWIELMHARGLDPHALLAFTIATDFEGDQWTFLRPPHADLERLLGAEVQELNLWQPLPQHAREQVERGRVLVVDMDTFWLPDTRGVSYQLVHGKSAIAIEAIDEDGARLRYFHNAGFYELAGDDYRAALRVGAGAPTDPSVLSPYCELVWWPSARAPSRADSRALLVRHAARRPAANPIEAMAARFVARDQAWLLEQGLPGLHQWAFGTLRMCGGAFELAASYLRWLDEPGLVAAADEFAGIATGCKALQFKLARAVNARRALDAAPAFAELATAWTRGQAALDGAL
jgi:hypothetical protein